MNKGGGQIVFRGRGKNCRPYLSYLFDQESQERIIDKRTQSIRFGEQHEHIYMRCLFCPTVRPL